MEHLRPSVHTSHSDNHLWKVKTLTSHFSALSPWLRFFYNTTMKYSYWAYLQTFHCQSKKKVSFKTVSAKQCKQQEVLTQNPPHGQMSLLFSVTPLCYLYSMKQMHLGLFSYCSHAHSRWCSSSNFTHLNQKPEASFQALSQFPSILPASPSGSGVQAKTQVITG